jgi:hypothetical protein
MPDTPKPQNARNREFRNVTHSARDMDPTVDSRAPSESTPIDPEREAEQYRLYRLCPCAACAGTGKVDHDEDPARGRTWARCKSCRGEGRRLEVVATCGTKEAVGVALVTLASEGEWDECPFGLMFRPEGETGRWLLKPWGPSARNISDAGRTLARSKNTSPTR